MRSIDETIEPVCKEIQESIDIKILSDKTKEAEFKIKF